MKKLIRAIFVLVLSLVTVALYACDEEKAPALSAEEAIKVLLVEQETYVTGDFDVTGTLFYKGTSYPLTWTSNNTALAVSETTNANGNYTIKVTRPESEKQSVTLTASLKIDEQTATKDFNYNVYPIDVYEISDAYKFAYSNKAIKASIDLDAKTTYEGKEATITWTVDPASANVVAISNGKVTFDEPTEDTPVKIWAEFSYNGQTAKRPFNLTLIPATVGPAIVTEFEDGDSFKFGLYQESFGKYLYITGEMSGYYFATTEDGSKAADVTVHVVEGGYQLTVGGKYIEILVSGSHNNVVFSETPSVVWQWDATLKTFTLDIVNPNSASKTGINMLGTSGTYNTLSANLTSKTDAYVAHLYELPLGPSATPVAGQSYPFAFYQESEGKHMYFTGVMSGYYVASTTEPSEAVEITVETTDVEGEYNLSFVVDGKKQYINLVGDGKYTNIKFVDEAPATHWTWNEEYYTYVMDVKNLSNSSYDGIYYMGTYGTNKTFGASAISYAATSYVAHMYAPGASLPVKDTGSDNGGDNSGDNGGDNGGSDSNTPASKTIALNVTSLGLTSQAYTESSNAVDGVTFNWVELGNYGNGIQMRNKLADGGKNSKLWNSTAFSGKIVKIELTYSAAKSAYANANAIELKFGTSADNLTETIKLSTVKDQKSYTITPTGDYTFFSLEYLYVGYSHYWDSITIYVE